MNRFFPILIVVIANTIYQICAKSTPSNINTFASLSITYAVGSIASIALYYFTQNDANLLAEYHKLNWSSFVLGIVIVGLEAGFILAYKVGWTVSTAQITQCAFLAAVLIVVGRLLYHEAITPQKISGIVICLAGLYLINR